MPRNAPDSSIFFTFVSSMTIFFFSANALEEIKSAIKTTVESTRSFFIFSGRPGGGRFTSSGVSAGPCHSS
jgi:hypothetical protein